MTFLAKSANWRGKESLTKRGRYLWSSNREADSSDDNAGCLHSKRRRSRGRGKAKLMDSGSLDDSMEPRSLWSNIEKADWVDSHNLSDS